jgi:hypothetical protein
MIEAGMAPDVRGRWTIAADVERARRGFVEGCITPSESYV